MQHPLFPHGTSAFGYGAAMKIQLEGCNSDTGKPVMLWTSWVDRVMKLEIEQPSLQGKRDRVELSPSLSHIPLKTFDEFQSCMGQETKKPSRKLLKSRVDF